MASKHAKLKLALTRAIIDFFLQEDLYADELKIQGTLCVTADRSAIFVTQLTETINDTADVGITATPRNFKKSNHSTLFSDSHIYNDIGTDCPEDLTCKSRVNRQPPAAHTKISDTLHYKPSLGCLISPKPTTSRSKKAESFQAVLSNTQSDVNELPSLTRTGMLGVRPALNTAGLSLVENSETKTDGFFSLNSAILNAAAKSAIERLTSLSRENEQLQSVCANNAIDWSQANNDADTTATNSVVVQSTEPQTEVIDCSSAKKRRLDEPSSREMPLQLHSVLTVVTPQSNITPQSNDISPATHTVQITEDQPLMLVTPKRERISDDEADTETVNSTKASSASCESSPRDAQSKIHSPPSSSGQQGTSSGCLSPWSFTTGSLKEEPNSLPVTDWSGADWMRKPRTKFSQEQLQALEREYKSDPFLSTSADKRAELARRLNITEKNVQIWFQNQRRRRRAAAYSQMHYTLNDSSQGTPPTDGKTQVILPDDGDPTECGDHGPLGSPEIISDHEGENSRNGETLPNEAAVTEESDSREDEKRHTVIYEESLDDSSSSDLVIATDFSPKEDETVENHDKDTNFESGEDTVKEDNKDESSTKPAGRCHSEVKSKGQQQTGIKCQEEENNEKERGEEEVDEPPDVANSTKESASPQLYDIKLATTRRRKQQPNAAVGDVQAANGDDT